MLVCEFCCGRALIYSKFLSFYLCLCDGGGSPFAHGIESWRWQPIQRRFISVWSHRACLVDLFVTDRPAYRVYLRHLHHLYLLSSCLVFLLFARCYLYHPPPPSVCWQSMYSVPVHGEGEREREGERQKPIIHEEEERWRIRPQYRGVLLLSVYLSIHAMPYIHTSFPPSVHMANLPGHQSIPFDPPHLV